VFAAAGLDPAAPWGTHSLRKTFCRRIYEASGHDLVLTKAAMGHAHLSTTERYLAADETRAAALIRALPAGLRPGTSGASPVVDPTPDPAANLATTCHG